MMISSQEISSDYLAFFVEILRNLTKLFSYIMIITAKAKIHYDDIITGDFIRYFGRTVVIGQSSCCLTFPYPPIKTGRFCIPKSHLVDQK